MKKTKYFTGPMRLPFLILTPACVFLGFGTAEWTEGKVRFLYVLLAFLGALSTHISVNALNEYFDFRSRLDFRTKRTPFSGGSGTLPEKPEAARYALATGLSALVVTGLIGLYFVVVSGLALLPLGILGIVIVVVYTVWLTRYPFLCLIAPGLGFGPIMVMGTHFALTGAYSWTSFIASMVPFFLVSDLLLLNQFPDVEADKSIGRRHLPILVGRRNSAFIYGAFLLLAFIAIVLGVLLDYLPKTSLIGLIPLVVAIPTFRGALRFSEDVMQLVPFMGLNVILTISTPLLVGVGLLFG